MAQTQQLFEAQREARIGQLFGQLGESAVRLAFHLTGDREAALDLSQDAFVRALEALDSLRDPAAAGLWYRRILVNLCRDWIRERGAERQARAQSAAREDRPAGIDPAAEAERSELAQRVRKALLKLPLEYREALSLVAVESCTPREAAGILSLNENTLRWRLHEARRLLKETLDSEHGER